jgi:hypothetical protein
MFYDFKTVYIHGRVASLLEGGVMMFPSACSSEVEIMPEEVCTYIWIWLSTLNRLPDYSNPEENTAGKADDLKAPLRLHHVLRARKCNIRSRL